MNSLKHPAAIWRTVFHAISFGRSGGMRRIARPFAALAAMTVAVVAHASDPSYTVTSTDDAGPGTLRQAITDANLAGGANTIGFDATAFAPANGPYTIQLDSALPDLTSDITITGPGANVLTVRGEGYNDPYRIFTVAAGQTVSISGLTLANGYAKGADGDPGVDAGTGPTNGSPAYGGAIYLSGTLTLTDCVLSGNTAQGGTGGAGVGDIVQDGADGAAAYGGAIYCDAAGVVTATRCTFSGNHATGGSGGGGSNILNIGHSGGGAGGAGSNAYGGAIYLDAGFNQPVFVNCTFTNDVATGGWGGTGGASNFSGAEGAGGMGGDGYGGAIWSAMDTAVYSCSIALCAANPGNGGNQTDFNQRAAAGTAASGGIYMSNTSALQIANTIVAANTRQTSFEQDPEIYTYPTEESDVWASAIGDAAHNLIGEADHSAGRFIQASDILGTVANPIDPKVDPLGAVDNGGPVTSLRLRKGSPAVDKAEYHTLTNHVDGRGFARTVDLDDNIYPNVGPYFDGTDIGAFESASLPNDLPVIPAATTTIYGQVGTDIATVNGSTQNTASGTNNQLVGTDTDEGDVLTYSLVSGTIPDGLTFNSDGTITGTPTAAGQTTLTFKVNDGLADSNTATLKLYIKEAKSLVVNTDIDNSTDYDGVTSLREAINASWAFVDPTITFDAEFFATAKTITVNSSSGAIGIYNSLTIDGPAAGVTLSGGDLVAILQISDFGFGDPVEVNVNGLTLAHGLGSSFTGGGAVQVTNMGGVPTVTFTKCTFSDNSADNTDGGAIMNGSIFFGSSPGGTITLDTCTLANNHADGVTGKGGAIYQVGGTLSVYNCTIANNHATGGTGGGLYVAGGTVSIGNTIVAHNAAGSAPDISGSFTTLGYNIIGDTTGATASATTGDQFNTEPGLADAGLADNGGPTQTIALAEVSHALDQGKALNGATTDQRGAARPRDLETENATGGDGSDIGAFEYSPLIPVTITLGHTTAIYDGTAKSVTATTDPDGVAVSFTYNGSSTAPTNAGSYDVVATVTTSGYTGSTTGTLTISKAAVTIVLGSLGQTYNGSGHAVTVNTTPADVAVTVTYNGGATLPVNAGNYPVAASVTDTDNYTGSTSGTLVIAKAPVTVGLGNLSASYDGSAHAATVTTSPGDLPYSLTYNGSATAPTAAGSYTVVATVTASNYGGSATGTLVISKRTAPVVIASGSLTQTYDKTAKPVTVTTIPAGLTVNVTYGGAGSAPVNAGTYAVVATVAETNYSGSSSATLTINKAPQQITLTSTGTATPGHTVTLTATADSGLPVTLEVTQGNATLNGTTLTINAAGDIVVKATQVGDDNHLAATATLTINGQKLAQTITFSAIPDKSTTDAPFVLVATASSGLPVSFTVVSGPAMLDDTTKTLTLGGVAGVVRVRASQAGNAQYLPAPEVSQSFLVTAAATGTGSGKGKQGFAVEPGRIGSRDVTPAGDVAFVLPAGSMTGSLLIVAPTVGLNELIGFTVDENGAFTLNATQQTVDGPKPVTGTGQFVAGVMTGSFDEIGYSFEAAMDPDDGPTAEVRGLYVSTALGSGAGTTYTIVGSNGNAVVLVVTPTATYGGAAAVGTDGGFSLQNGDVALSGAVDPVTTTVNTTLTVTTDTGSTTVDFGGLKDTTLRTDRLINLSARAHVGTGEKVLISGFVIGGHDKKPVLIRAAGPSLTTLSVTAPLANPQIRVVREGKVVASNDDWGTGDPSAIMDTGARVGAFPLEAGSKDSALLATLSPGVYTAIVSGGEGIALAEIYDASENPQADYQRLINISARGDVGTGANVLIGGLVITGNSPKQVLIRGVGPTLATQGIQTPLADPVLKVFKGSTVIAKNDNWDADAAAGAAVAAAAAETGAFALPAGSKDAALIVNLAPGLYTVHVLPAANTTPGIALVEVYEVPPDDSQ
ncbi:MAG TPA: MBG domain-containing protein [Opitutus sp.]|nr:MBG domain-containing protein [Opitutus sp.]